MSFTVMELHLSKATLLFQKQIQTRWYEPRWLEYKP